MRYRQGRCLSLIAMAIGALIPKVSEAHGFAGAGWLHPLTGLDHMLAMLCVGAWSAQLGKRALISVPAAFVAAMAVGWFIGHMYPRISEPDAGVALSVVILGMAIGLEGNVSVGIAAAGTALFGLCHGYAHGAEMPASANTVSYMTGFLITTAALHVAGAVAAMLVLEQENGRRWMRLAGSMAAIPGLYWFGMALAAIR